MGPARVDRPDLVTANRPFSCGRTSHLRAAYVSDEEIDELVARCAAWARPGDVIDLTQRRDHSGNGDQDDDYGDAGEVRA